MPKKQLRGNTIGQSLKPSKAPITLPKMPDTMMKNSSADKTADEIPVDPEDMKAPGPPNIADMMELLTLMRQQAAKVESYARNLRNRLESANRALKHMGVNGPQIPPEVVITESWDGRKLP